VTILSTIPDKTRPIATGIDLCIRGDSLVLDNVSHLLGVKPTSGFEKGDAYVGREKRGSAIVTVNRVRPFGVWHFCTSELLQSNSVEEHVRLLIDTFSPSKAVITRLISDPSYSVQTSIWVLGYTFCMSSAMLVELASFAEDCSVACWEEKVD